MKYSVILVASGYWDSSLPPLASKTFLFFQDVMITITYE